MSRSLPPALRRARELVAPAMQAALAPLSPEIGRVIGYHLGWVDRDGRPAGGNGGKALRPALAVLSAEAAGSSAEVAMPGAVAVELVHSFSLLHDDVMDGDETRHHHPAAWTVFGEGRAILTGDALFVLAMQCLLDAPSHGVEAARSLAEATRALVEGQAQDLAFEARPSVTPDECLVMERGKTGALLACSASIGALLAGASDELVVALHRFGLHLGLAFQAVDDVLGIWGHPEVTGKPAGSDLRKGKKTLPVSIAVAAGGSLAERLTGLLADGPVEAEQVTLAAKLVAEAGGREGALAVADEELATALAWLDDAAIPPEALRDLAEVAGFVTAREL